MDTPYAPIARLPRVERGRTRQLYAGVVAAGVVVGALASVQPAFAVAAVLGLALVPIVLTRPIIGLAALVFLSFLETVSAVTGALSLTKIVGAVLVLAWLAVVTVQQSSDRVGLLGREPLLAAALALFVAWAGISLVWAEAQDAAMTSAQRFALNFTLFPIAFVAVRTPRHVLWIVAAFIAGGFTAAAFGLVQGVADDPEAEGRLGGAGINPNQLGSYLVVAMVFAIVLAANRRWSGPARAAMFVLAGLAALGVFMTVSRGALVGMAAALLVTPFVIGRGRRSTAVAGVALVVLGSVAYFATLAPASAVDRVLHPDRGGGSGREDLWRVGWRMVEDKPVHGVGAGNFPERSIDYLLRPGATERDTFIVDEKKVAHNVYLTVLSELGAVGLTLFLLAIVLCLRAALRAARRFAARGDPTMELVSRGLVVALVSLLAVAFFSSALYVKQFWVLLALAPALRLLAERGERTGVRLRRVRARAAG